MSSVQMFRYQSLSIRFIKFLLLSRVGCRAEIRAARGYPYTTFFGLALAIDNKTWYNKFKNNHLLFFKQ